MGNISEIWDSLDHNFPVYINSGKLDVLIGRLWGKFITSFTVSEETSLREILN